MCICKFKIGTIIYQSGSHKHYRNGPKDRQALANSADQDQTAPREQSDQGLHCLPFYLHLLDKFHFGKKSLFKF